ncbi:hypothetical protein [Streptomyces sp. AV19]|uniref:hypothetical protein n=1 Tax=Streptomyces sp. AV19 TaxID=2793068 RepID=UPI0024136A35|nr:hypothetical protein [Streptomyces sp. AV19]MDG4531634.1 hypothetical protein [Streptomyces sp. AV19]
MSHRFVWRVCLAIIGTAAAGMTGWSLFTVAHDRYGVPSVLAIGTAAVFDGAAIACLHLAGQAVRDRRSALGPHCATIGLAAVSVYLNHLHARLIHGGTGAFLLFATPTVTLLVLAGLSWSATRAQLRAEDGEVPLALPRYGVLGWLLAGEEAWAATKERAVTHVTNNPAAPSQRPVKARTAAEALTEHFADVDPVEAIRTAHSAMPGTAPAELAAELGRYGIQVSAVDVALVLGHQPGTTTVHRPDPVRTAPVPLPTPEPRAPLTSADILSGQPETVADAARQLIGLGITDKGKAVPLIVDALGLDSSRADSVRRTFDRQLGKHGATAADPGVQLPIGGVGQGGGGYA